MFSAYENIDMIIVTEQPHRMCESDFDDFNVVYLNKANFNNTVNAYAHENGVLVLDLLQFIGLFMDNLAGHKKHFKLINQFTQVFAYFNNVNVMYENYDCDGLSEIKIRYMPVIPNTTFCDFNNLILYYTWLNDGWSVRWDYI